jgi:hypothetical protein
MDSNIELIQVQKAYASSLYVLHQQMKSRFASRVQNETIEGAISKSFSRIGEVDSQEVTERHGDTPLNEVDHSRRWVTLKTIDSNVPLDEEDKWINVADPTNKYQQVQAAKLGRDTDDIIIAAAFGTALAGEDQGTSVAFKDDSTSINGDGTATSLGTLATAAGSGSVADISLAKMLIMSLLFDEQDIDEMLPRYWAVTPKDAMDMLNLSEVKSADYNTVKALATGWKTPEGMTFMGFEWIKSTRIPKDTASETAYRTFAWCPPGIILGVQKEMFTRISERTDKRYMTQIYAKMKKGAVRFDGDLVHECLTKVAQ